MTAPETMIERCARAGRNEASRQNAGYDDGDFDFSALARAVLSVLRDPSEGMIGAGDAKHWGSDVVSDETIRNNVRRIFQAMIDFALAEKG